MPNNTKKIAVAGLVVLIVVFIFVFRGYAFTSINFLGQSTSPKSIILGESETYQPGTYTLGLQNIPNSAEGVNLVLTREKWPEGTVARVTVVAKGEGQTFNMGPMELSGGVVQNIKTGKEDTTSSWTWWWPGEAEKDANGEYVLDNNGNTIRKEIKITDVEMTIVILQPIKTDITLQTFGSNQPG